MTAAARWAAQQWERGHPRLATNAWFELRELYCNRVLPSAFVFTRLVHSVLSHAPKVPSTVQYVPSRIAFFEVSF